MRKIHIIFLLLCLFLWILGLCRTTNGAENPYDWAAFCAEHWLDPNGVMVDIWIPKECDPNGPVPEYKYLVNWEKITFWLYIDMQTYAYPGENLEVIYWRQVAKERLHPQVRPYLMLQLLIRWRPICGCYTMETSD